MTDVEKISEVLQLDDIGKPIPPWRAHPNIPRFSIGWRMGVGEEYLAEWTAWFSKQNETEKTTYVRTNQAPFRWWGIYDASSLKIGIIYFLHWAFFPITWIDYKIKIRRLERKEPGC